MKKRNIYFFVLLLLAGLTIVCNKAETLVAPEDGSYQLLVVTDGTDKYFPYSNMSISYFRTVSSDNYRERFSKTCGTGYESLSVGVYIACAPMGNEDTVHTVRCGSLRLGDKIFVETHRKQPIRKNPDFIITSDWLYQIRVYNEVSDCRIVELSGPTEFKITGSDVIQDVGTIIDIPETNEFITPQPGAVVNANEDLVIKLKNPLLNGVIWLFSQVKIDTSYSGIVIRPAESSDKFIMTSSQLQEFVNLCPESVPSFLFMSNSYGCLGEIPLYDKNGIKFDMLKPWLSECLIIDIEIKND